MRTTSDPKHPNNDWYEELCALAAIGELSSSEFAELQQHLFECEDCRALYADFCRISAHDLGLIAVLKRSDGSGEGAEPMDEKGMLDRLLDRAQQERVIKIAPSGASSETVQEHSHRRHVLGSVVSWLRRPAMSYGTAGLLLCAVVGVAAFRLKESQLSPKLSELHFQVEDWKERAQATKAREDSAADQLRQSQAERESLQKVLLQSVGKYSASEALNKNLETQLSSASARAKQLEDELEFARQSGAQQARFEAELRSRLEAATSRATQQDFAVQNLRDRLRRMEEVANAQAAAPVPMNDSDARLILGARDLHIVDMYDVGGDGKTKRSYGRVYYVEKKLLLFYAFDLRDARQNRIPEGFQAWGYRQANETRPENLGLFSVDDASANRWVLKVNNPRILDHIDAVFVTVESPAGSPSPRGRKLLYANLAGPANHP
jgi:hypothetical protein